MKFIRNHPEARWLPSRCHFAMFRLVAWLRLSHGRAADVVPTAYVIDREQNAFEQFTVSGLLFVVSACYLTAVMEQWLVLPVAIVLAVLAVPIVVEIPFFAIGLAMPLWRRITGSRERSNVAATSFGTMVILFATSVWFAWNPGWPRIPAIATLFLFAANGICAIALLPLRTRIAEREARCAG